jgi:hypothetical protein
VLSAFAEQKGVDDISFRACWIAALTDPEKLGTLSRERAANPRLQKCVYWLATVKQRGGDPAKIIDDANEQNKVSGKPYAEFVKAQLLRNLKIAEELGLINPEGLAEFRKGNCATITLGPYKGEEVTADHIIPREVCPELDNQIFNLELLPATLNSSKSDKIGDRQVDFAKNLHKAGLLSEQGLNMVLKCRK